MLYDSRAPSAAEGAPSAAPSLRPFLLPTDETPRHLRLDLRAHFRATSTGQSGFNFVRDSGSKLD